MNQNITQEDLILLAYNELNENRNAEVINAIRNNAELREAYTEIIQVKNGLDVLCLKPDPTSLQIIMEESSSALEVH